METTIRCLTFCLVPLVGFLFNTKNISLLIQMLHLFKGTGKTRTLIAAIQEIIRSSDKYVLVCAASNSACDELCERLLNVLTVNEVQHTLAMEKSKFHRWNICIKFASLSVLCKWPEF